VNASLLVAGEDPEAQLEPFVRDDRRPDFEQTSAKMDFYRIDLRKEGFFLTLDGRWTNSSRMGELDWDGMRRRRADDLHAIYDAWQQGNKAIILVAEPPAPGESKTDYVSRMSDFCTHAILHDGSWLERNGFGPSDDPSWCGRWGEFVRGLPQGMRLTVVDYHS
jgi:hypothetical protein